MKTTETPSCRKFNVLVNASILGTYGTMTALGEELGWRGYLQPRLDTAGVRGSFVVVGLCWSIYHAPFTLVDWSGTTAGLAFALAKGLVLDVLLSYLWARLSYTAKSLWPAPFQLAHGSLLSARIPASEAIPARYIDTYSESPA